MSTNQHKPSRWQLHFTSPSTPGTLDLQHTICNPGCLNAIVGHQNEIVWAINAIVWAIKMPLTWPSTFNCRPSTCYCRPSTRRNRSDRSDTENRFSIPFSHAHIVDLLIIPNMAEIYPSPLNKPPTPLSHHAKKNNPMMQKAITNPIISVSLFLRVLILETNTLMPGIVCNVP